MLLTESEKNEIKRKIGRAMLNILKQATIRIILQKNPADRREDEIDRIIAMLKSIPYFKDDKNLSYPDYRDLA